MASSHRRAFTSATHPLKIAALGFVLAAALAVVADVSALSLKSVPHSTGPSAQPRGGCPRLLVAVPFFFLPALPAWLQR